MTGNGKPALQGKTLQVTGFLDEFEKDDVKGRVKLSEKFAAYGVALEKKGNSLMGLCPFHEDKNPSLSVDDAKGLFHCFGCGASGDVFDLVMKCEGTDFRRALKILKGPFSTAPVKRIPKEQAPEPVSIEPVLEPEPASISLEDLTAHYHNALKASPAATAYLKKRGLPLSLAADYRLGFADGALPGKLSQSQKAELTGRGILTAKGAEHFAGCLVAPLVDEAGQTVSFYGRRIQNTAKIRHLYLSGNHAGLFNPKALQVFRERIILTESVIDALSLLALGVQNAVPCYGVHGFTDLHLSAMKGHRVKTVCLAFDDDEAGRRGAEKLKDKLLAEGFCVQVIFPSQGKDWNDFLLAGGTKEEVQALLESAEVLKPQADEKSFQAEKQGPKYLFTFGKVRYRVLGVKELFVSSLRVNLRAESEGRKHLDNVDLYSARSRGIFAGQLAHSFDLETSRVEKDLLQMVEYLEAERDKLLEGEREETPELTEEERTLGMDLLTDPSLFDRIVSDTEALGYVGEEVNKMLVYLAASSRKLPDPVSVIVVSQSAAGKSYLIDTVKKLIPPEDSVSMTSLSDQALNYLPEEGLLHKFLVMGEAVHSEVIEHQIREMLSGHELSRLVTVKDPKTGQMTSRIVRKKVIVSAVMSTTDHEINPENASRCFMVNTDESEEQTRAIHQAQRKKYSIQRYLEKEKLVPHIVKTHHAAQRLLRERIIVNPFAEKLDFPSSLMRSRRDHERFIDLIACVCFLRQFQKQEQQTGEGLSFVECDLEDYKVAYRIMTRILPSTLTSFPKSAQELYEAMRQIIKDKALEEGLEPLEVSVTQREIRERSGLSQMFVKRNVRVLAEYEYVHAAGKAGARSRKSYRLVADESIGLLDLSMIPDPETMKGRMTDV